ncbi:hypothetical protein VCV18_011317 [Metarhizium anisopliae]
MGKAAAVAHMAPAAYPAPSKALYIHVAFAANLFRQLYISSDQSHLNTAQRQAGPARDWTITWICEILDVSGSGFMSPDFSLAAAALSVVSAAALQKANASSSLPLCRAPPRSVMPS